VSVPLVLAVLLVASATALALPPVSRRRLGVVAVRPALASGGQRPDATGSPPATVLVAAAASIGGVGVAALFGGGLGMVLGAVAATAAFVLLRRLEPAATRRRRERLAADLPTAVDLLGACLHVGRPPDDALRVVAAAVGGPLGHDLDVVRVRLVLGADPVGVWREIGAQPGPLAPLGRTMARSLQTGAPLAEGLRLLASDLRGRRRAAAEQQARSVGVRAAAPLGLCFLPAFVLIGIVPSIAGAFASMSWF
jgi:Flp pilus assembly protein TadB